MYVNKMQEAGYEFAALGFSLSYNTSLERTKEILPKYAFGKPGEDKFLESISIWIDITAPRFWWQEMATYRIGNSWQSESTMHTISKKYLDYSNFEYGCSSECLEHLNRLIDNYRNETDKDTKKGLFLKIKNDLPEGFLQRRIMTTNYKSLRWIIIQRQDHRLPQWKYFCNVMINCLDHPEFIVKDYQKDLTDFH